MINEISHTSMLRFCNYLYEDISQYIDEWASFVYYHDELNVKERARLLRKKLERLKELISKNEKY